MNMKTLYTLTLLIACERKRGEGREVSSALPGFSGTKKKPGRREMRENDP
jgi:hypothetical protein